MTSDDSSSLGGEAASWRQRIEQDLAQMRAELESIRLQASESAALLAHAGATFAGLVRDILPAASSGQRAQRVVCWEQQVVAAYLREAWRLDTDGAHSLQVAWRDAGLIRADGFEGVTCVVSLGGRRSELLCVTRGVRAIPVAGAIDRCVDSAIEWLVGQSRTGGRGK